MNDVICITIALSLKCDESSDEPVTTDTERLYQLNCFISQGQIKSCFCHISLCITTIDVKYMITGLKLVSVH